MLKPKQIDALPGALIELYSEVETDILADMARRISAMDYFIPAAQWQYRKLIEMGNCHGFLMQALASRTGKTRREIERMLEEAGGKAIRQDAAIYKRAGLSPPELAASPSLQAALSDGLKRTEGLFENLTGTTADTATRQFERALDRAWLQVQSGGFSQEEAVRMAVKELAAAGVECIAYPSGHVDHLDVAVRRAAVTGANQAALRMQEALADEMECDLVEVTAHAGARVGKGVANHAGWQGKVYSRSGESRKYPPLVEATGYGSGEGLGGWNCRHSFFPFLEGASDPAYTKAELEEMNAPRVVYNGERLTEYEASQKQRAIERNIRRWKREYKAMEAAGLDASEAAEKLQKWRRTEEDFLAQTGLRRQAERERVEGFGRAEAARASKVARDREAWYTETEEAVNPPQGRMKETEQAAIQSYISGGSYTLNAKLRGGLELSPYEQELADALDAALEKLPAFEGTVYRSLSDFEIDDIDLFMRQYEPGAEIPFPAYLSTSVQVYDERLPIQYVIQSRTGRDLRLYNPDENEILFPRNRRFRVTKVVDRTIYMEELP